MSDALHCNPVAPALQQHASFAAALRVCGQKTEVLGGPLQLLVLQRRMRGGINLAMISRACLTDPEGLADRLRQAGLYRHLMILSPEEPTPALARIGAVPVMTPGHVAMIDLREPHQARRAALHQKWRNRLRHGEKQHLRVTRQNMPPRADHWLFRAEADQRARRGYRNWQPSLTLAYARENPGQAKLFTAFEGRDPVAAMLFLRHGNGATYHIGHTTARGRALSAHNLLLWQAAGWLASRGHCRLDLGLIDTRDAPGLARFKLGAGAQVHRLGGSWVWWPPLGRAPRVLARLDRRAMAAGAQPAPPLNA